MNRVLIVQRLQKLLQIPANNKHSFVLLIDSHGIACLDSSLDLVCDSSIPTSYIHAWNMGHQNKQTVYYSGGYQDNNMCGLSFDSIWGIRISIEHFYFVIWMHSNFREIRKTNIKIWIVSHQMHSFSFNSTIKWAINSVVLCSHIVGSAIMEMDMETNKNRKRYLNGVVVCWSCNMFGFPFRMHSNCIWLLCHENIHAKRRHNVKIFTTVSDRIIYLRIINFQYNIKWEKLLLWNRSLRFAYCRLCTIYLFPLDSNNALSCVWPNSSRWTLKVRSIFIFKWVQVEHWTRVWCLIIF